MGYSLTNPTEVVVSSSLRIHAGLLLVEGMVGDDDDKVAVPTIAGRHYRRLTRFSSIFSQAVVPKCMLNNQCTSPYQSQVNPLKQILTGIADCSNLTETMSLEPCSLCGYLTIPSSEASAHTLKQTYLDQYRPHFNSNDHLDARSSNEVNTVISCLQDRLLYLDTHISRLEQILDKARRERQWIRESIDIHVAATAPVHHIPDEILSNIFLETIPPLELIIRDPQNHNNFLQHLPWTASQVCQRWRNIAISSPQLWSVIAFSIPGPFSGRQIQDIAQLVKECLSRSRDAPLSLQIISGENAGLDDDGCQLSILRQIVSQAERWQNVSLNIMGSNCYDIVCNIKGRMSRLRRLYPCYPFTLYDLFAATPQLCDIDVIINSYGSSSLPFYVPMFHLVQSSQHCLVRINFWTGANDSAAIAAFAPEPISFPSLSVLRGPDRILRAFTAPSLKILGIDWDEESNIDDVLSFLKRSSCQLQELDLSTETMLFPANLIKIIEATPSVTNLSILFSLAMSHHDERVHVLNEMLVSSLDPVNPNCLLQKLERLQLQILVPLLPQWIPMLQSRVLHSYPLKSFVYFREPIEVNRSLPDEISELQERGLCCSIYKALTWV